MDVQSDWTSSARRIWLWPVAILVSFPIGGYIADLVVDGVDSVGAALAGGLILGAIIGAAEWFALRQWVSWLWIPSEDDVPKALRLLADFDCLHTRYYGEKKQTDYQIS